MHAVPLDLLELELLMVVNRHGHVEMEVRSFGRVAGAFTTKPSLQPQCLCNFSVYCVMEFVPMTSSPFGIWEQRQGSGLNNPFMSLMVPPGNTLSPLPFLHFRNPQVCFHL